MDKAVRLEPKVVTKEDWRCHPGAGEMEVLYVYVNGAEEMTEKVFAVVPKRSEYWLGTPPMDSA
jgi:hypothetical protein